MILKYHINFTASLKSCKSSCHDTILKDCQLNVQQINENPLAVIYVTCSNTIQGKYFSSDMENKLDNASPN